MVSENCPKCGEGVLTNPVYKSSNLEYSGAFFTIEILEYKCNVCGYTKTAPCKDSENGKTLKVERSKV